MSQFAMPQQDANDLAPHCSPVQGTIGGCCASCAAFRGCNAWRYCSQKGGCRLPEGQVIK